MSNTMPTSLANGRYQLGELIGRGGMAEVRVAAHAVNLRADHAKAHVARLADVLLRHRLEETRPTRAGLKLRVRAKERQAAAKAGV